MKRSGSDNRIVTQTTAREAIEWVNVLARRMGCAGPPACGPVTADAATAKREGGTGTREAVLKANGQAKYFDTREDAQAEATRLMEQMNGNRYRTADFRYWVEEA